MNHTRMYMLTGALAFITLALFLPDVSLAPFAWMMVLLAVHNKPIQKEKDHETESRMAIEKELFQTKQLYDAMAEHFPDGVIGVLDRNMKYLLAGGMELEKIGLHSGEIKGEFIFDNIHPGSNKSAEIHIRKSFNGEKASFEIPIDDQLYNVISVPLPESDGSINKVMIVIKNITERKKMEYNLKKALEKEKELNALKSRFVTMASHEFRTPLTTILSSVFLLENYTGPDYESGKKVHINRIKRSVHNLNELLDDFLLLGKLEEGMIKVSPVDIEIQSFLSDFLQEVELIKKVGQQIHVEVNIIHPVISTDEKLVKNIITNLLSNAIKYSSPDSTIDLSVEEKDNNLIITVADQGIGIPPEEQREIFKRFYRAQNAANIEGTGLGLNLVRKYLRLLRGSIDFTSTLNKGSIFTVTIPVSVGHMKKDS